MSDFMMTFTGREFYPANPDASMINIEDIAHALSMMPRFGGWNQYCFDGTKFWQYRTFESALKDLVVLSTTATVKDKGKKTWVVVNQQQDNSGKQEEIIIESEKE